ncbi:sulfurtransferase [Pelomonas sp. SE-A7]|uniref:sulfurtransferase n=1 Tax=Pelomonas sp. SE-A7 TaxID=3054953 RepID=UPI00259C7EF9|nr:sulfurtransferase [Pelomonas sp. SE-A7]MDM4767233.1 sulfurtransferase [Pelomonas sp. SE-A7]
MSHPVYRTLISAAELLQLEKQHQSLLIVDCSFELADTAAGERGWRERHLPGAHYLHLDRDTCAPMTGLNGRHPLPDREWFAERMRALGLKAETQVVAYDNQGSPYAAHLWWMLRWLGHEAVAVLDGGLAAWSAAGGPLSSHEPPAPQASSFAAVSSLSPTISAEALQARLGTLRLIDARAGERFRGEVEPLDKQAGHIPGASNRFFKDNLAADGRFKPAAQLRAEIEPLLAPHGAEATVHYCGSGVTACINLLAMEHAGLAGSTLYPGSWSEWSADPRRPIARG